ncbi:MAG: hypothetical protein RR144_01660 [Clostridia bacterium]
MKNVRLIITKLGYEILSAFADDNYLYGYIVNNESELWKTNILYNPDVTKQFDEYLFIGKDNISEDDEIALEESIKDIKRKNISYYIVLLDTETREIRVYNNLSGKVNLPIVDMPVKFDDFEIIKKIEELKYELNSEDEMEV